MVGEAGKDLGPGPAEITEGKLSGKNNGHKLLNSPPGLFNSFPVGDLEETIVRRQQWLGFWQVWALTGKTSRNTTLLVSPENETLGGELVVIEKTLFLDGTVGIGDVPRVEVFVAGDERTWQNTI